MFLRDESKLNLINLHPINNILYTIKSAWLFLFEMNDIAIKSFLSSFRQEFDFTFRQCKRCDNFQLRATFPNDGMYCRNCAKKQRSELFTNIRQKQVNDLMTEEGVQKCCKCLQDLCLFEFGLDFSRPNVTRRKVCLVCENGIY